LSCGNKNEETPQHAMQEIAPATSNEVVEVDFDRYEGKIV
jgi:hypothetical protein